MDRLNDSLKEPERKESKWLHRLEFIGFNWAETHSESRPYSVLLGYFIRENLSVSHHLIIPDHLFPSSPSFTLLTHTTFSFFVYTRGTPPC